MSKLTNTVKQLFSLKLCRKCSARLIRSSTSLNSFTQSHTDSRSNTPSHLDSSTSTQSVFQHIHKVLDTKSAILSKVSHYHFNGLGKAVRPRIVLAAAQAFNFDEDGRLRVSPDQLVVAMVAEMIHTASLVHDDIIDESLFRRGNPSVFSVWGQSKGAFTGDYILGAASVSLAKLRHNRVMRIMSQILEDLVQGEFMQLGTKSNEDERFNHYIEKSYRKTASLLANSCQAVAVLSGTTESKIKMAFEYGKNLGISFQLIDDSLDYLSSEKEMGKPTGADLKLGLATAPVLFAAHEFPRLNTLIMRRFSRDGDAEEALHLVRKSSGLEQTRDLANRYGQEAMKVIHNLKESKASQSLIQLVENQLIRTS